jgi:hypothetical protein
VVPVHALRNPPRQGRRSFLRPDGAARLCRQCHGPCPAAHYALYMESWLLATIRAPIANARKCKMARQSFFDGCLPLGV